VKVMSRAIFPAPDHDHGRCASAAIAHAEAQCAARAKRLTPMRRQVLETLLASHRPLGAYEIMSRLRQRTRPAPITIYRALDFLIENGLVHRIETRNAFVACVHNHGGDDLVIFLLCECCGAVGEAPGGSAAEALKASSRAAGFSPKSPVIEIAWHLLALSRTMTSIATQLNRCDIPFIVPSARCDCDRSDDPSLFELGLQQCHHQARHS
jgi:Fur family zinc uptake transcriptional regulator